MTPRLERIRIYPLKSFDALELHEAKLVGGRGLANDREYRLVDSRGAVVNGKRKGAKIIPLRASFAPGFGEWTFSYGVSTAVFQPEQDRPAIEAWLGRRLGLKVRLERDSSAGFPDDENASGPTVVSRATLITAASWFSLDEQEMRRRVRANIEIDGVPAFWEDGLYGESGQARPFRIGDALLEAVKPCARCAVPSRDSFTGEIVEPRFAKIFAEKRRESLPQWAERSRFDHFYRLAVNTRTPASENGKTIEVGDDVVGGPSRP